MNKTKILNKIAMMIQNDEEIGMKDGRSAGIKKNSMAIKIIDKNDKQFIIKVEEV